MHMGWGMSFGNLARAGDPAFQPRLCFSQCLQYAADEHLCRGIVT